MTCGIYRITNLKTGRLYIGSAHNIERRWRQHKTDLKRGVHANSRLQWAWRRDGPDSFMFEIVEFVAADELTDAEQRWIDETGCANGQTGYNVNPMADGSIRSPETRAKVSAAKTGEGHHLHKLTTAEVEQIKRRLTDGERCPHIALTYGVSRQAICDIKANRTWGSVPWQEERPVSQRNGEHHYLTHLTKENVADIKRRLCGGERTRDLAAEYGITHASMSDIKYGRTWKHIPWPEPYRPRKDDWLSVDTVREIKRRIANGDRPGAISAIMKVHVNVVYAIKNGLKYTDITL